MWLGFKSLRSSRRKAADPTLTASKNPEFLWASFRKGLLIQVTNPKTALFWLSMVSFVIQPKTPVVVMLILVVGTTLIALSWHSVLAVAFSHPAVVKGYVARRRAISFVFGVVFLLLGGRLVGGAVNVLAAGVWA